MPLYHTWTIRVPKELKSKIEELAQLEYKSVNRYVVDFLVKKIKEHEQNNNNNKSSSPDLQEMLDLRESFETI